MLLENSRDKILKTHFGENLLYFFSLSRSLTFTAQSLALPFWELLVTRQFKAVDRHFVKKLEAAQKDLHRLLKADAKNISQGLYPVRVLEPEPLKTFSSRYPKILWDGVKIVRRRLTHSSSEFSHEAKDYLRDVPDYFQRNFHFQSGGYLTEESAEIYEHQVEILFSGAADAMRRLMLPDLKKAFPYSEGEGLHFLEIGAGTGRLSRFVKLTFPKAKITLLDLSYPYLKKAQDRLREFTKIDFIHGDAADLPFQSGKFDAVYSSFLFHELPLEIRRKVISESLRVLKPGGWLSLVDSVQQGDKEEFAWALQQFPKDFHEPFYSNYVQNPMEGLLQAAGLEHQQKKVGFLSKSLSGKKNL